MLFRSAIHTERGSIFVSEEALKYALRAKHAPPSPSPDPPLYVINLCVYVGMSFGQETRLTHIYALFAEVEVILVTVQCYVLNSDLQEPIVFDLLK